MPRSLRRPAAIAVALAALGFPPAAGAASVAPQTVGDEPSCAALGEGWSTIFAIEAPATGHFVGPDIDIELVRHDDDTVDWSANGTVDAVLVVGTNIANAYRYVPGSTADGGLEAPVDPETQQPFAPARVDLCHGPSEPPAPAPQPEPQPDPDPVNEPGADPPAGPGGQARMRIDAPAAEIGVAHVDVPRLGPFDVPVVAPSAVAKRAPARAGSRAKRHRRHGRHARRRP